MFPAREQESIAKKALVIAAVALVVLVVVAMSTQGTDHTGSKKIAISTQDDNSVPSQRGLDVSTIVEHGSNPKNGDIVFEVSVPKKKFTRGEHVPVMFKATNKGSKTIRLSTMGLPISRFQVNGDSQLLGQGKMHLTYESCRTSLCQEKWMGAMVLRRPKPCADEDGAECVTLRPGESVESEFDLAKYYSMSRSGVYTFQVGGKLTDVFDVSSQTALTMNAVSNVVSFEHVNVIGSIRVPTAMELGSLDRTQAEADAASQHVFVAAKDSVLMPGTFVTQYKFGLGATINLDVEPDSGGRLEVSLNGIIRLVIESNSIVALQDGTDSGTVSVTFTQFNSILSQKGSHHVTLEVADGGYKLTIDGICHPGEDAPTKFECPTNILAVVDDSPTRQYGQEVTVVVSGGMTASNLVVSGGSVLRRRRLGTGCGSVSIPLRYWGCGTSSTMRVVDIGYSVMYTSHNIKTTNLYDTRMFGTSPDWTQVDYTFSNMANALCQSGGTPITSLTFSCKTDCPNYYAYVYKSSMNQLTIYLCNDFYDSDWVRQMGTVVHELSHFTQIGNTLDYAYGCQECRYLSPDWKKRDNAGNYGLAIEQSC